MPNCNLSACVLPDIEIYGGDTQPWQIPVVHADGKPYTLSELNGCTFELSFIPYTTTSHTDVSSSVCPSVTKDGRLVVDGDGYATIIFEFTTNDTLRLDGKFIYQIAYEDGGRVRIGQGKLIIKPNTKRGIS